MPIHRPGVRIPLPPPQPTMSRFLGPNCTFCLTPCLSYVYNGHVERETDMANILKKEKRVAIVKALCEGNGIRATSRLTGTSKNTVSKLLRDLGKACSEYQDEALRQLPCKRVEMDEIWSSSR